MARSKKRAEPLSDSSLSPPPDELSAQAETTTIVVVGNGKRKANNTAAPQVTKRTKVSTAVKVEDNEVPTSIAPTPKGRTAKKVEVEKAREAEPDDEDVKPLKATRKRVKSQQTVGDTVDHSENGDEDSKPKKAPRKKKDTNSAPLADRTTDTNLRVGAHVSIAGGIHNAIPNVLHIGGNGFAIFMKNQRKWDNPPLDPEHAKLFVEGCKTHNIDVGKCCVPHGSYLVNLAHPDADRKKQAYDAFYDDLVRCAKLGIRLYNFHPGNCSATTREDGIRLIAEHINTAHKDPATGDVVVLLETMASLGNTIGGTFHDLATIIGHVENKDRVGVCLDTCHVFAAGYDLREPKAYQTTMTEFDKVIGLRYLKALHVNDSKAPFNSNRDLHARIGTGYLGLRAFHNLVNDTRLHGLPMILETPVDSVTPEGKKIEDKGIWAREIKMLEGLVGIDAETKEFLDLAEKLQDEGRVFREKTGEAFERKLANAVKKEQGGKEKKKRGKKKVDLEAEDEDEE